MKNSLTIPEVSLVLLMGASGSGKSTFAKKHFLPTEIVSSDTCRALVSDDENELRVNQEAFELVHSIIRLRLKLGKLTVVDATNVRAEDRKSLIKIAKEHHVLTVAIAFKIGDKICHERNANRPDRQLKPHVVRNHNRSLNRSLRVIRKEGVRYLYRLESVAEVDAITKVERQPLWSNRRSDEGPFDIIGDVHGCYDELLELLKRLDYTIDNAKIVSHPAGRRLGFVGDLIDRGPKSPEVVELVMNNVEQDKAFWVPGNHDTKLGRYFKREKGREVKKISPEFAETISQFSRYDDVFKKRVCEFIDGLVSHFVFDGGKLVVAHAGLKEDMHGRSSGRVREFCLYGETTGELDEYGYPIRIDWAADYRGQALVVYGHTTFLSPRWLNNTVNIDTGCAFGGQLTALRYPERETVSVDALQEYAYSRRPLAEPSFFTAQQLDDLVIDIEDISGKSIIETKLRSTITVREENAAAALEVMSRFAVDPRWLIYLPPTMSPCQTSSADGWLERPEDALSYYRTNGLSEVVLQEKHMGSRAVVIALRDPEIAISRFGFTSPKPGVCYTRTGRPFFNDVETESELLRRLSAAIESSGLWDELETDWICLDAELMPWSQKAHALLLQQYAPVACAAENHAEAIVSLLKQTQQREIDISDLLKKQELRQEHIQQYRAAYQPYCWDVDAVNDLKLAPFHLLASEGAAHFDKAHDWHMAQTSRIASGDPTLFQPTTWKRVNLESESEVAEAIAWWESLTSEGGEGMVVKPLNFYEQQGRKLLQPAVKCRGREYLRIIYGAEYLVPENLQRLKQRGLNHKRSMALREFALGVEGITRFIAKEPLRRTHACAFGVLAMESEPVDPRL